MTRRATLITGLIAWFMRACDFAGWTSFWRVVYVLPGFEHDERLPVISMAGL